MTKHYCETCDEYDDEVHDHEGPENDDYINRAYQDMAGPNPHSSNRPANPHWTSTFNDRRTGPRR